MKKIKNIIEGITRRGVKTLCHPRAIVKGHISLSTVPDNYFKGYVVDRNKLSVTETGGLITTLPTKSNIRDLEPELDKLTKSWGGFRSSYRNDPNITQVSWIDGFNRFMATESETPDGISFTLRGDTANEISQRGKLIVQCDESFCDILIPTKISVNMNKYSVSSDDKHGI